jgi:hypothetical protein
LNKKQKIDKMDKAYNVLWVHFFLKIKQMPQKMKRIEKEKDKIISK